MSDPKQEEETTKLHFRLERLDRQIGIEFDLITHRMTWLMVSQSFLFSAFATSVAAKDPRLPEVAQVLQYLLPGIGMISASYVGLAIGAAHDVIEKLKPLRETLEERAASYGYETLGTTVISMEHGTGNLPSKILPWVLLTAWAILLDVILCSSNNWAAPVQWL